MNKYIGIWKEKHHNYFIAYYYSEYNNMLYDVIYDDGTTDIGLLSSMKDFDELIRLKKNYKDRETDKVILLTETEEINKYLLALKLRR